MKDIKELLDFSIINIDKPSGPTSFTVSEYVCKQLGLKKSSHFGTLDPKVTGVLPVALGRACKLTGFFLGHDKEYIGIMHIHKDVSASEVQKLINKKFVGDIKQLPPIKSRVRREERVREVKRFKILEQDDKDFLFVAEVEGGTYIRKLCLPKDSEIILNGSIKKISEISNDNVETLKTLGFKDDYFKEFRIIKKQKTRAPKEIIKIEAESGIPLELTKDHPVLVLRKNKREYIEAEKLKISDKLVCVKKINISPKKFDIIESLDEDFLVNGLNLKKLCVKKLIKRFGSIREVARKFKIDRKQFNINNNIWLRKKYLKLSGDWNFLKKEINEIKTEKGIRFSISKFVLDNNLMYLLGLIASDGCVVFGKKSIRPTRIKFHNKELTLIKEFSKVYKDKFQNFKCKIRKIRNNLFEVDAYNPLLANICYGLGIISPQLKSDFKKIFELNENLISRFLKGYFDGDGNAFFKLKKSGAYSNIDYFTSHFLSAKRIFILLKRLGINSRIFKKINLNSFNNKENFCFVIRIKDILNKKSFIEKIGANHHKKKDYLEKIHKYFKNKIKKKEGYLYEKIKRISTKKVEGDFVYDITVGRAHNFLAEGNFVVSNCHDLGVELDVGAHMLELRRVRAGIFSEPCFNLYKFKEAVDAWKDGDETLLRSMLVSGEDALKKIMPVVEVKESALKQLLTGKPIFKKDLVKDVRLKKGEIFAVFCGDRLIEIAERTSEKGIFGRSRFVKT